MPRRSSSNPAELSTARRSAKRICAATEPMRSSTRPASSISATASGSTVVSLLNTAIHSPRLSATPRATPPAKPSLRSSETTRTSGKRSRTSSTEPSCEPLSTTITSVSSSTARRARSSDCRHMRSRLRRSWLTMIADTATPVRGRAPLPARQAAAGDDRLVLGEHVADRCVGEPGAAIPVEVGGPLDARPHQALAHRLIGGGAEQGVAERRVVVGIDQQGGVAAGLGQGRAVGRHHGHAAGHRLEHRQAEALVERGHGQRQRSRVEAGQGTVVHVAERPQRRRLAGAHVGTSRAGGDELDALPLQPVAHVGQRGQVLAGDARAHHQDVGPLEPVGAAHGLHVGVRGEAAVDAVGHHDYAGRVDVETLGQLAPRELRGGDHAPGALGQQRHHVLLVGGVDRRIPARMAQGGEVVEDHDGPPRGHGGEVGRAIEQARLARCGGQQGLLPQVAGAVGERGGRPGHGVARRVEPGQPRRHLHRHALHAADLAPGGGARVDQDRRFASARPREPRSRWSRARRFRPQRPARVVAETVVLKREPRIGWLAPRGSRHRRPFLARFSPRRRASRPVSSLQATAAAANSSAGSVTAGISQSQSSPA